MAFRTKVLVVGAGPAGSTAGRFLSANGIDTILVEKNLSFIKPCGGGIPSTAFDELGIPKKGHNYFFRCLFWSIERINLRFKSIFSPRWI